MDYDPRDISSESSDDIPHLAPVGDLADLQFDADLANVGLAVGHVAFDSVNDAQKYPYASAAAVLSKVNAALFARGISVSPDVLILSQERTPKGALLVTVQVILVLRRGSVTRTFVGIGSGADHGDKAVMKAITAAHKYAYALAFAVSWGDDPEADSSTDREPKEKPSPAARASKAKDAPAKDEQPDVDAAFNDMLYKISLAVTAEDFGKLPSKDAVVKFSTHPKYQTLVAAHKEATAKLKK